MALGAPRPLLLSGGDRDPIFPEAGTRACYETLRRLYSKAGARDACELELFSGGHEISTARLFDFYAETL